MPKCTQICQLDILEECTIVELKLVESLLLPKTRIKESMTQCSLKNTHKLSISQMLATYTWSNQWQTRVINKTPAERQQIQTKSSIPTIQPQLPLSFSYLATKIPNFSYKINSWSEPTATDLLKIFTMVLWIRSQIDKSANLPTQSNKVSTLRVTCPSSSKALQRIFLSTSRTRWTRSPASKITIWCSMTTCLKTKASIIHRTLCTWTNQMRPTIQF